MIYRKWKFEDNIRIAEIEKDCFPDPWSNQMLADAFLSGNFSGLVAEENGEIAGFIAVKYCLDEGEINIVAVKEKYRRKGVASALMKKEEDLLKKTGVEKLYLEVRESNAAAQSLYEKLGYKYSGTRKNYYGGTENALIMSKVLK